MAIQRSALFLAGARMIIPFQNMNVDSTQGQDLFVDCLHATLAVYAVYAQRRVYNTPIYYTHTHIDTHRHT